MAQNALALLNYPGVPYPQESIAFGSISGTYAPVGTQPFGVSMLLVIIVSTLNATVQFSWDGVNPAFPIVAGATVIIDFKSDNMAVAANYGAYVKTIGSPSSGSLYVGGFTV